MMKTYVDNFKVLPCGICIQTFRNVDIPTYWVVDPDGNTISPETQNSEEAERWAKAASWEDF